MMQVLGYIFVALIVSSAIVLGDYFLPGNFLKNFIDNNFIETFANLVGFNIASVIFLLGQLLVLEERFEDENKFNGTRKEIKHNSYLLLFSFVLSLIVLIFRPDLNALDMSLIANRVYYFCNILVVALLYLAMVAVFEILKAVFTLGKFKKRS